MIDVVHKTCAIFECGTRPSFNYPGESKGLYCSTHKLPGMVRAGGVQCKFEGCTTRPSFNHPGESKGLYCSVHKLDGMVRVTGKKCKFKSCTTEPIYNYPGETRGVWCKSHKLEGMINVKDSKCAFDGCKTIPCYNRPGESKGLYCTLHKLEGMIDVRNRSCAVEGCNTIPSYNFPGETRGLYCADHKLEGMIDVKNNTCRHENCDKVAGYSFPGNKLPEFCLAHKSQEMVDVKNKHCTFEGCNKIANSGYIGEHPIRCSSHLVEGMINSPRRKCKQKKCKLFACYGLKPNCQEYCADHIPNDSYMCLTSRKCKNADKNELCLIVDVLNSKGLCRECDPEDHFKFRKKAKEELVKNWLDRSEHSDYISYDRTYSEFKDCFGRRYRPDFLFDCETHFVVLEVDEKQHKGKTYECDFKRMCDIAQSLGLPTIFVRYNPDSYLTNKKRYNPREGTRKKYLMSVLSHTKELIPKDESEYLRECKIYYDGFRKDHFELITIDLLEVSKLK